MTDQTDTLTRTITVQRFEDPGHSWLRVPRVAFQVLGVDPQKYITSYSYEDERFLYLEEDQDEGVFRELCEVHGLTIQKLPDVWDHHESRIRSKMHFHNAGRCKINGFFRIYVGNVGQAHVCLTKEKADRVYENYVHKSKTGDGRAAGEPVTMSYDKWGRDPELIREYDPMTHEDLKVQFRQTDDGDAWGNAMHWHFAVANELDRRDLGVPAAWHYRPSPMGPHEDVEEEFGYAGECCADATPDALISFGHLLNRYADMLELAGRSY